MPTTTTYSTLYSSGSSGVLPFKPQSYFHIIKKKSETIKGTVFKVDSIPLLWDRRPLFLLGFFSAWCGFVDFKLCRWSLCYAFCLIYDKQAKFMQFYNCANKRRGQQRVKPAEYNRRLCLWLYNNSHKDFNFFFICVYFSLSLIFSFLYLPCQAVP